MDKGDVLIFTIAFIIMALISGILFFIKRLPLDISGLLGGIVFSISCTIGFKIMSSEKRNG